MNLPLCCIHCYTAISPRIDFGVGSCCCREHYFHGSVDRIRKMTKHRFENIAIMSDHMLCRAPSLEILFAFLTPA